MDSCDWVLDGKRCLCREATMTAVLVHWGHSKQRVAGNYTN